MYGIVHIQDADNYGVHGGSIIGIAAHEMTHFFFRGLHFGDAGANRSSYFVPYAANAGNCYGHHLGYEKYRLGWIDASQIRTIDLSLISSTTTLYDIADQDASKIKLIEIVVDDLTAQRIVLENRGWDIFETQFAPGNGMQAPLNQGVLAYHLRNENEYFPSTFGQILSADGSYDWKLLVDNSGAYVYGSRALHNLEVIDKGTTNPYNGYDERQRIYITNPITHQLYNRNWIAGFWPSDPTQESARGPYPKATNFMNLTTPINDNVGDKYDLFNPGAVISPFSNPPTKRWNTTLNRFDTTNLAIEILSFNPLDRSYEIRVVRQNFNDLRPSRPIGLRFDTTVIGQCPHIIWDRNREQDVDSAVFPGQYRLERSVDGSAFSEIAILVHPVNEFYDSYSSLSDGIHTIKYRMRVEDNTNQMSEYSDGIEIDVAKGTLTSGNAPAFYSKKTLYIVDDVHILDLVLEIQGHTLLYFCPNTHIYVHTVLTLDQVEMNNESHIECMSSGIVTINDNARVDKLKTLIVQSGGRLFINNQSITKMSADGQITIKGYGSLTAAPINWVKLQSYYLNPYDGQSYPEAKSWKGFFFERNSSVSLSHAIINGAQQALRTNDSRPSISNCTITKNLMGVYSYGNIPQLMNSRIDSNAYAGNVGYYHYAGSGTIGNRFNKNGFAGAHLFECADLWQNNRLDSNSIGVYAGEGVTVAFNAFTLSGACDTTNGNSVRWNTGVGLDLEGFSYPTFECDNSVWGNTGLDIRFSDSGLDGWENFEDIANIRWGVLPGSQLLGFNWYGPYPTTDPVLRKTNQQGNKIIDTLGGEPQFRNAMNAVRLLRKQKQYIPAIAQYRQALQHVRKKNEAELCLRLWQQTLTDALYRDTLDNPVKQEREKIENEIVNKLRDLRANSDSLWMRRTATYLLANTYQREKKFTESKDLYLDLLQDSLIEPELERRALTSLVVLQHHGLNDYNSAYNTYLYLNDRYPRTKAVVQAKVALLLPLTDDDIFILKDQQTDSLASPPGPMIDKQKDKIFWSTVYPNPFNPSTTIKYALPSEGDVSIRLFNALGSKVYERDLGRKRTGIHNLTVNVDRMPAGIYLYVIEFKGVETQRSEFFTGKMILAK